MIIQLMGAKPANVQPKQIFINGTYDAAFEGLDGYSTVTVDVPEFIGVAKTLTSNVISNSANVIDLSSAKYSNLVINSYTFLSAYERNTAISGAIDFTGVGLICPDAFYRMFAGCNRITSIDLSNLRTAYDYALMYFCASCSSLVSVDFSSLCTITNPYVFYYAFEYCTSLTSLSFPALSSTSFGNYSNQFNKMLKGVTGCTVHFPSNLQSVIGSWSDVTNGFGGTNTTVLFDLTATS